MSVGISPSGLPEQGAIEERRAWLLGAAVAYLQLLATMADEPELRDLQTSLRRVAASWGGALTDSGVLPLRLVN